MDKINHIAASTTSQRGLLSRGAWENQKQRPSEHATEAAESARLKRTLMPVMRALHLTSHWAIFEGDFAANFERVCVDGPAVDVMHHIVYLQLCRHELAARLEVAQISSLAARVLLLLSLQAN
jgi:hypothetical protein